MVVYVLVAGAATKNGNNDKQHYFMVMKFPSEIISY